MRNQVSTDEVIARIAERQAGVISHRQLRDLGLKRTAVHRRIQAGRLLPLHRGVYGVGHRRTGSRTARWAAVLRYAPDAVLSHATAADEFGFRPSSSPLVHLTVAGARNATRGVRLHRTRDLPSDEVTALHGMPITTPARTLLDLAAHLSDEALALALDRADQLRVLDFAQLHQLLQRHAKRPGSPSLRAQLTRYRAHTDARSELERLLSHLCDRHGIPRPQANVTVEGRTRDFFWPDHGLVVEADSYAWHRSPDALDTDRERDVELTLAGLRGLRFTHEQITGRPVYVTRAILAALT